MASTPQIILIDGPAGAGKTTLALKMQAELNCEVIHLDRIYNGWDDALTDTLTYKLRSLIESLRANQPYSLPIYNWSTQEFDTEEIITPSESLIIEGVGAGQSAIRNFAKALSWVEVDDETGMQRVLARDGEAIAEEMRKWKVREAEHFAKERTREFADFIMYTA